MAKAVKVRLESLTGLRAIAAGLVFLSHFGDLFAEHFSTIANRAFSSGRCGVSFFFVLSGFVLAWSARPDDKAGAFYWRRFARIVPAHVAAWVIAIVIISWQGLSVLGADDGFSLFLLQAWFPGPGWHFAGNPVAWSLSCEAFFYLVFPVLLPFVEKGGPARRRSLCLILFALAIAVPTITQLAAGPVHPGTWIFYVFPVVRCLEFTIGIGVACMVRRGELLRIPRVISYVLAIVGLVVMQWAPISWISVASMLIPFTVVIVAGAQADVAGEASAMSSNLWVRLGSWSYAFYLIHELVLRVLGLFVDISALGWGGIALWTAVAIVVATLGSAFLYTCLERPAERWLRRAPPAEHQ